MLQLLQSYQVKELQTARNELQHSDLPTRIKRFAECTLQLIFVNLKHISESSFKRSPNRQVDEFYLSVFKVKFSGFSQSAQTHVAPNKSLSQFYPDLYINQAQIRWRRITSAFARNGRMLLNLIKNSSIAACPRIATAPELTLMIRALNSQSYTQDSLIKRLSKSHQCRNRKV